MGFLDAIAKDRGQPATIRIGVVTSTSPLLINVQGAIFSHVGRLNAVAPALGATVVLIGQSAVSSDGSSWLLLGTITPS